MSLHAINSQYTAQVKQAEHVVSEMQKLEEQNKKLREEIALSKQENQQRLDAAISEKERLKQEVQKLIIERDEHGKSYSSQIQTMQEELHLQKQQQSSSMNKVMEKMVAEKERLQVEVSAKGEEITRLKSDIQKIGQTLQDSEKEWLSVLDRETQDKILIAEQLKSVENEMKSKDFKVQALKQDLDSLHEKLAEAATAIRQGSDLLKAKELEASTSRVQIENILVSVQEKDKHNIELRQALQDMESELRQLEVSKECSDKDLSVLSLTMSDRLVALEDEKVSLQTMLKQLREIHQCEVDSLRGDLNQVSELLKRTECTLNDKEMAYQGENQQNVLLQEKIQHLHAQLQTETENLREAGIKQTAPLNEIQTKEEQVSCMTIQISHQKELLAGLSQQLREKDASVAQIIESASNERIKYAEENINFLSQLESLENAQSSSMKQLEHMSLQLEESKAHLSRSQSELETKDSENRDLVKERDDLKTQLTKLTKEKEVMKKKLQAALVVRKDLLKKLEEHEHQIEQNVNKGIEISGLQDRLQELTLQAQATTKEHEDIVADIKRQVYQKEGEFLELTKVLTVRDSLVEKFEINMQTLQAKLDEQEVGLTTALHNLNEKSIIIDQLNSNISEKEEAFEQERSGMMLKLEKLQEDTKKSEESLKEDMSSSSATAVDIENELAKVTQEKAMMQKKAQAALLARKETIKKYQESERKYTQELSELKDDYKALLEQHCQQTNDLNAVQLSYDQKVKKFKEISQASVSQLGELETLRLLVQERDKTQDLNMSLSERESQLANKDKSLIALEQKSKALSERMSCTESQLEKQSSELQILQNTWAETQQQLGEEKEQLKVELEKAQSHSAESQAEMESHKLHMESLQQEKESAFMVIEQLHSEVAMLDISPEEHEMSLKERDDALLISQALATEKEELIAALEQQLQRQIHLHEFAMEKMRTEVDELQQRTREDASKTKDLGNQSKTALLTRKLQAALVSRKEILKDNSSLKEQMDILSAKNEEIGTSSTVLEMSVAKLKQQKEDLESSVSSLSKEKENLIAEVDRILNDNHNLSAACESLKLTIENITQQKQAFSCQLESLKDSQTDELSEWKSKHTELKQEYESLLQAYENVSSEMDKMRQLLEGARRERQEALFEAHKSESERENLEKQVGEMEDENEKMKEKMRKFTKAKQQKLEELVEENKKIRIELLEFDDKQKSTVEELTIKNNHLETEIHNLVESSEALRGKLTEIQLNNVSLAEALKEARCSLEKWPTESKACEQNMQLKLDDALILNNSMTAQIESQKTELAAQQEINELMQNEKETLSERIKQMQNKRETELGEKDDAVSELQEMINRHSQKIISLNEKVRILEDDKSILQEELENVQEISDKVKNENDYLEIVILKNSEKIDELTEAVNVLQVQNTQLSSQLTESKEKATQVCQEMAEQQLKLVKEFEEKLKMFQRGNEGSRNIKKELQELLKEKHHEINHLQHDSIKYQELILDLERSLKASESAHEQVEKELKEMTERISCLEEGRRHLEAELTTHNNLLNEAKKDLTNISSEKDQLVEVVSEKNSQSECQVMERTKALQHVAEQQKSIFMEREVILQQHIEELLGFKEKESQVVLELKRKIDSQDLQMNTLKREADTNLAKLAALSSKQGFVITRFLEDIRVKEEEVTELQVTKSRLERTLGDYTVAATAQQRQLFIMGASNRELNETVELLNQQLQELSEQVERLEQDRSALNRHLTGSVDSTSKMEFDLQQLENTLLDTESQLLLSQSHSDMLQVDFEKQEAISLHLKSLLQNKDAEIYSLLSSRDGQMSGYLEQLQANHCAQVEGYEDRLTALYYDREKADKEFRRLENKVKSLQMKVDKSIQEKEKMAAQMETFRNSMVSLQTERERLMSEYRMSEARNQTVMQGKEESAEGDLSATKGLKHEIRTLLHQMDDLNSENAMLRAQLIRYREDLNQVLSLKDSQLKELLRKQQDAIKNLENQKATAEKQNQKILLELEREGEASNAFKAENSKLQTQVTDLEANILALNKGMQETNKGKVIADLQHAVAAKAAECNDLQQKLFAQKVAADDWKGSLQLLERETERKLGEAEDKYNTKLDAFEQEVELMRNEKETADQRVAELARDLMQTEQLLSNARVQSMDLKSQNESLGKAMAALQNDRDQLIEDFKILRNRYDEELRETQGLATLAKERHILVQKLSALESKDAPSQLTSLVDKLSVALSEKEGQLQRVSLENDTYSSKVSAFSRSMASLQDDRDRLMEELAGAKRTFESSQGLGPEVVVMANTGESNSHRSSGIQALQTGRNGLVSHQFVQMSLLNVDCCCCVSSGLFCLLKETRQRVVELQSALQQAQAFKLQTETEVSGYQAELAELR
uniref:Golgin B1 n=1 Tax=Hucho hucho TaxID=62062 RepID=A0A4W5Q455_9TELE